MGVEVELNSDAVRGLLKSSEMMDLCQSLANDIAQRAGAGYEVSTRTGINRVNASVYAATEEAVKDNLKNNTILKSMGR